MNQIPMTARSTKLCVSRTETNPHFLEKNFSSSCGFDTKRDALSDVLTKRDGERERQREDEEKEKCVLHVAAQQPPVVS